MFTRVTLSAVEGFAHFLQESLGTPCQLWRVLSNVYRGPWGSLVSCRGFCSVFYEGPQGPPVSCEMFSHDFLQWSLGTPRPAVEGLPPIFKGVRGDPCQLWRIFR